MSFQHARYSVPRLDGLVARERLLASLAEASGPVVWLHGPPGAGKTALAIAAAKAHRGRVMWLHLDALDGDPATFLAGLAEAASGPWGLGEVALPAFSPEYLPGLAAFTGRTLAALLAGAGAPLLVLDDYQELPDDSPLHRALAAAFDGLLGGHHPAVLVLSRRAPPPPYARLRASGALHVVGPELLAMDGAEIAALADRLGASPARAARVLEASAGWAAGAVLLLMQHDDREEVVRDFFAAEVLDGLEEETRHVLRSTSLCPVVSAEAAAELSGDAEAGSRLAALRERGLFVSQAGSAAVFRLHPLLRGALQASVASHLDVVALATLQRRSAALLAAEGHHAAAFALYSELDDTDAMVELLLGQADRLVREGRVETLLAWADQIPGHVREAYPWLLFWIARAELYGDANAAAATARTATLAFAEAGCAFGLPAAWSLWAGAVATARGGMERADEVLAVHDAYIGDRLAFPSEELEAWTVSGRLLLLGLRDPAHAAVEPLRERLLELDARLGELSARVDLLTPVLYADVHRGYLVRAELTAERLLALVQSGRGDPVRAQMLAMVTAFLDQLRDPRKALRTVEAALEQAPRVGVLGFTSHHLLHGASAVLALGRPAEVEGYLERLPPPDVLVPLERALYHHVLSWRALVEGDPRTAIAHADEAAAVHSGMPISEGGEVARVVALHQLGDEAAARALLDRMYALADRLVCPWLRLECQMVDAEIAHDHGDLDTVRAVLAEALPLAEAIGCYGFTWWRNDAFAPLLAEALRQRIAPAQVEEMIRRHDVAPPPGAADVLTWPYEVRLVTLGRFAIVRGGEEVQGSVGPRSKLAALLTTLVAAREPVIAWRVLDRLWPESDGDRAAQSLRTTLHRTRKLIGVADAIRFDDGKLWLDPRRIGVDAWAIEALAAHSEEGWVDEGWRRAARALVGGPFVGDDLRYAARVQKAAARLG